MKLRSKIGLGIMLNSDGYVIHVTNIGLVLGGVMVLTQMNWTVIIVCMKNKD